MKTLFFDLDGTLTNSKEGILNALYYAFDKMGIKRPDDDLMNRFIGPPLLRSFKELMGMDEKTARTALEKYREYYRPKGIFENEPYPGIGDMLFSLKEKGVKMAVTTSKPEYMSLSVLKRFGLLDAFDGVFGSLDDNETKSDVIRRAIEAFGIEPNDALMTGDRDMDVIGAKSLFVKCCGVRYGFAEEGELESAGADFIVDSVRDLGLFLSDYAL